MQAWNNVTLRLTKIMNNLLKHLKNQNNLESAFSLKVHSCKQCVSIPLGILHNRTRLNWKRKRYDERMALNALSLTHFRNELRVSISKDLNHFGGIASFFRDWAPGTLTGGA